MRFFLLQDFNLVSNDSEEVEADLVACVILNALLDLLAG